MIKIKQNFKFLTIVILSNSFVFFASKNHNKYDHTKAFPLKEELTTIRLPIKTPFEYSLDKLNSGIHISIKAKDGETIAPSAFLFSNTKISNDYPTKVLIQIDKKHINKISKMLNDTQHFYAFPFNSITKKGRQGHGPKELFL